MKKNRMMRLASTLLILTLLTTSAVSGTFAKYTTEVTASDSARVAKWSFTVNNDDITSEALTFNLFDTINDTGNTADEGDVSDGLIAPGTAGSFLLSMKNSSEVTADYEITLTAVQANLPKDTEGKEIQIPIEYSLDNNTWKTSISDLKVEGANMAIGGTVNHTVYWKWAYENTNGDAVDTALGIASRIEGGEPSVTVTATLKAWQVD